jgi:site-specific recombinase XerD
MQAKFLEYLRNRGYSHLTIATYSRKLHEYFTFIALLPEDQRSIQKHLNQLQGSAASKNLAIAAIKSYYLFLNKFGYLSTNPAKNITAYKKPSRLPKFALNTDIPDNLTIEQAAAITLLNVTGIRLNELITLKKFDVTNKQIKVTGKGNKDRIIPISPTMYNLLIPLLNTPGPLVFSLKRHQIQYLTRKHLKCNPHTLRHTFATTLINNGAPLKNIKDLLGHSNFSSTEIYTHLNYTKLIEIHKRCHPRG